MRVNEDCDHLQNMHSSLNRLVRYFQNLLNDTYITYELFYLMKITSTL